MQNITNIRLRSKDVNIKSKFVGKINKLKLMIKSCQYLPNSVENQKEINDLKIEIKSLKKAYKLKKKEVYAANRQTVSNYNEAYKSLKQQFNSVAKTCSKEEYKNFINELENLKLRKRSASVEKYRRLYGTTEGRTRQERISNITRIGIIIGLFVVFILPVWLIITYSTKTNVQAASLESGALFKPSLGDGAKINYDLAFDKLNFWNSLWNTLFLTIESNVLILLFASMAAWQLVRKQTWYSKVIFYTFVVAMILPFQAIMIPLMQQMTETHLRYTLAGTSIAYIGFGMALSIFMMHGFLKSVPTALEESAAVSGMNPFQVFFHVILPLLKTTFVTILVLNIMWIWNDYLLPSLTLADKNGPQTLQVKLIQGLASAVSSDLKAISAGVIILLLPPIVFFIFAQKKMISGITKGAIK